jgi:hypothetical protein
MSRAATSTAPEPFVPSIHNPISKAINAGPRQSNLYVLNRSIRGFKRLKREEEPKYNLNSLGLVENGHLQLPISNLKTYIGS